MSDFSRWSPRAREPNRNVCLALTIPRTYRAMSNARWSAFGAVMLDSFSGTSLFALPGVHSRRSLGISSKNALSPFLSSSSCTSPSNSVLRVVMEYSGRPSGSQKISKS